MGARDFDYKGLFVTLGIVALGFLVGVVFWFWLFKPANAYYHHDWNNYPTQTPTATLTPTPTITIDPCQLLDVKWDEEQNPCVTPTEEPTATPTPTPTPTEDHTDHNAPGTAPVCTTALVDKEAINLHVYRKGDQAQVKWWATGGDRATIYYKQVSSKDWQYSVDVANTGYAEINGLGKLDITFALQQHQGCGSGVITTAVVDGATNGWTLYR
jgi:hypothetical protein